MELGRERHGRMERTRWVGSGTARQVQTLEGVQVQARTRQAMASCFRGYLDGDRHLVHTCLSSCSQWP